MRLTLGLAQHCYDAACAAVLAAAGKGTDAGKFDDREKARLREQGPGWLWATWRRVALKGCRGEVLPSERTYLLAGREVTGG